MIQRSGLFALFRLSTLLLVLNSQFQAVAAFGGEALLSRLENAQCGVMMSIGRIPFSAMPPEWAASGAKLALPLEVEFSDEACADYDMNKERLLGSGRPSFKAAFPLNDPSFVSAKGQEIVKVTEGAYGCECQNLEAQRYGFRFFLDFPEGAVRNDVELPAERIYFTTTAWVEDARSLERAKNRRKDLEQALTFTRDELAGLGEKSSNVFQKALAFRESVTLVEKVKSLENQLAELEQTYPLEPADLVKGPNGVLFAKEGFISVKRFRGTMGTREQYHWVGKFTVQEFFED